MTRSHTLGASALSLAALFAVGLKTGPTEAQTQSAIIDDFIHRYVNLDQRVVPGPGGGSGVDGDDVSEYEASATAVFSDFTLSGIPLDDWAACRGSPTFGTVQTCLETLIGDGDPLTEEELHPGEIGGDVFEFDMTITNTSSNAVLTAFGFQSKFSESPALGSRIGDKLFKAERMGPGGFLPLGGVKKNGTSNGLFDGKRKFICVNSSDDYPAALNAGTENETLECAGGRTFDEDTNEPVLEGADGEPIVAADGRLPKGLLPGASMTIRLRLDAGTDDGGLHRAHQSQAPPSGDTGPLTGALDLSGPCPTLAEGSGNIVELVDFGDVKILRDGDGNCAPSFFPFDKNQFLTFPRRNWGFTDILDTRDDWPTDPAHPDREIDQTLNDPGIDGRFSFLDRENLVMGELNFASLVKGFGEHGTSLDPACDPDGSQPGACGGAPYVSLAEFYAYTPDGKLVRQEVAGSYVGNGISTPLTANVAQATATNVKATDPFEQTGTLTPPPPIDGSASVEFFNFEVIADEPATITNEGGQAGGNKFRVSLRVENTSTDPDVLLTSINFQTKERALTDINDELDGSSIRDRRDLRLDEGLPECTSPEQTRCFDTALEIGRFPNVIGNSLLSVNFVGDPGGPLSFIKKNGPFTPVASGFQNFICIKSGAQSDDEDIDQDVIETCAGDPTQGLAPGGVQTLRLEFDYGDFRGLILRVEPGTIEEQASPFGLAQQGGDFDCRDQRRLPFCHPDLVGQDWFTDPERLFDVIYVTVHQEGDAPTVMNYEANFGQILAMGGFVPSAEFSDGTSREQVVGEYCSLPGGVEGCQGVGDDPDDPGPGNPSPQAEFDVMCVGLACSFDGTGSTDDGTIVSFDWDFGDDNTGTGATVEHTYAAAGTFTVTLVVTDDEGASDTGIRNVQVAGSVNAAPTAAFSVACDALTCLFTDQSTDADGSVVSWAWDFGDDGTSGDQNPVHTYAGGGDFLVELTVTDNQGVADSTSQEVTVDAGSTGISLVLEPRRVRGLHEVQLTWSGATSGQVDIHRNGSLLATVANAVGSDNTFLDRTGGRGRGTYTYQVCEAGSTAACSEQVTATFN